MSAADDQERLRYLRLKAKAAQGQEAEPVQAAPGGPRVSVPGAVAAGVGQGALGFGDEVGALIQADLAGAGGLWDALQGKRSVGEAIGGALDTYRGARGENRQIRDAAWEQQPWAYGPGYGAGTVASMALPLGHLAGLVRKGPGLMRMAGRGLLGGFEQGAAAAVGGSDADLASGNLGGLLRDVGAGGLGGAAFGGALAPVAKLAEKVAPQVGQFAYRRAVKAAGPMLKDVRALQRGGRLESVGKKLLEMGLIPNGAGVERIAENVEHAANARGADVGSILGELDSLLPAAAESSAPAGLRRTLTPAELSTPNGLTRLPPALEGRPMGDFPGRPELIAASGTVNQRVAGLEAARGATQDLPGFNPAKVATRLRSEILDQLRDQPALQSLIPGVEKEIQNLEALGDRRLAFTRANDIKRGYDKLLNWTKEQTPAKELLKQIRGIINEEIENGADAAASATGNEGLLGRFRSAKRDYGDLSQVAEFARDQVARREANRFISPSDYGMGIASGLAGFVSGHPTLGGLLGLVGTAGNKLARERGNSVVANGALGLSRLFTNPGQAGAMAGRALTSLPGRRPDAVRSLLDLLAPSMFGQSGPAQVQSGALLELNR